MSRIKLTFLMTLLFLGGTVGFVSCASSIERRDPLGEAFPVVAGESLDGRRVALPEDVGGEPILLLIGYKQNAQFDIDRWILGLMQAGTPVRFLEVPTIPGLFPGMIAGTIDEGMRSGIPSEDWGAVVTLYGDDAKRVASWTGNEDGLNSRVVLLDADGEVVWFHDRGYSAGVLMELDARVRELQTQ